MITADIITEIFCAVDEFCKEFDKQMDKKSLLSSVGKVCRYRKASLSDSEIMTILIVFQLIFFRNFKYYYQFFIRQHMKESFPYNRFVELESRVFFQMMFFLNLPAFGRCTGISFVDDRDPKVWAVLAKTLYGKLFADRGYISHQNSSTCFSRTGVIW